MQQKARIDAIIAGFDAFAGKDAGICPFPRGLIAASGSDNIDNAADNRGRIFQLVGGEPAGISDGSDLVTFAAARAGIRHRLRARVQSGFEGLHRRIGCARRSAFRAELHHVCTAAAGIPALTPLPPK